MDKEVQYSFGQVAQEIGEIKGSIAFLQRQQVPRDTPVPSDPPYRFECFCKECGAEAMHLSHIGNQDSVPERYITATTGYIVDPIPQRGPPVRTCLACGLTTYRKEK